MLLLSLSPLLLFFLLELEEIRFTLREDALSRLTTIRDLRAKELNNWLDERIGDVQVLGETLSDVMNDEVLTEPSAITSTLLGRFHHNYDLYDAVQLINYDSTEIVFSSVDYPLLSEGRMQNFFKEGLGDEGFWISPIYYGERRQEPAMMISMPIYSSAGLKPAMILLMEMDLKGSLYPLLIDRTGLGDTGESLLINDQVVAVSPLRWR